MAAYLVSIEGLRGPEAQVWYEDSGRFVGCPVPPVAKLQLPEREKPWKIDDALEYARQNPDLGRT